MVRHTIFVAFVAQTLLGAAPAEAAAQGPYRLDLGSDLIANGEGERYLRVLQLLGKVPMHPVGIRPWSAAQARVLRPRGEHPWTDRFTDTTARNFRLLRTSMGATWNSSFPQGEGEGPVWLGRGVTVQGRGGVRVAWGALSAQLAPIAFVAQNQGFATIPNGLSADGAFRDARFPGTIDAPQRFGNAPYGRIDAGYSEIAIEPRWMRAGFSTMPLAWGPARDEPLVLGPGAGGFPHLFLGTSRPIPLWIGELHVALISGRLEQSRWSPATSGDRSRMASSAAASFVPRGVPGLELGFVRFEHRLWRAGTTATLAHALRPLGGILSDPRRNLNGDENGYASVFGRWAIAPAGFEVYAEYGREDYAGNLRWLVQKPDDLGNLLLGVQRAMWRGRSVVDVLRLELVNAETSSNERGQRGLTAPIPPYTHTGSPQGHTLNGQFLGSATAYGGAGWLAGFDRYSDTGRRTIQLTRTLIYDWLPAAGPGRSADPEVRYVAGVDGRWFTARAGTDFGISAAWIVRLNAIGERGTRLGVQLAGSVSR